MPKQCGFDGCPYNVSSNGYCWNHQYARTDEKYLASKAVRKPVKCSPGKTARGKPIAKISKKQGVKERQYATVARLFKIANPVCQVQVEGCTWFTTDVHHKKGRGEYLLAISTFLACCRNCHDWIEAHPTEAKKLGFSENRLG